MFLSTYYHTIEQKGRLSLPKEFRNHSQSWVITRGLDGGLFLFPEESFKAELVKLEARTFTKKHHRDFVRLMTNEAKVITTDAQGRVHLPEYLIKFAGLIKQVVVVGSLSRIEIWDAATYHEYLTTIESQAEAIAESLEPLPAEKNQG